jgi:hypothetical protein
MFRCMKLDIFNELLAKELTRKEFLIHLGILLLAVTGIAGLLKTLSDPNLVNKKIKTEKFGNGTYGA